MLIGIKKNIENIYLKILLALCNFYVKKRRVNRLQKNIKRIEDNYTKSIKINKAFQILLNKKIKYLDVGSRNGPDNRLLKHKDFFSFVLSEPEKKEAMRLKASGYKIIMKIVSDKEGKKDFFVTNDPLKSSTLKPDGGFQRYNDKDNGKEDFKIKENLKLDSTTLDKIEKELKIKIDYLKLDTQGSEYLILNSMKNVRPIFIQTEVSCVEIYKKQFLLYDIGKLLYNKGYIIFRNNILNRGVPFSKKFAECKLPPSLGLPMHGDVFFMPDWTRKIGRKIIKQNELIWASIMLYEGQQQLLLYINSMIKLKNREKINRAISVL